MAKIACKQVVDEMAELFAPRQLGYWCGGSEAVVHAARCFLNNMDTCQAVVKLDFTMLTIPLGEIACSRLCAYHSMPLSIQHMRILPTYPGGTRLSHRQKGYNKEILWAHCCSAWCCTSRVCSWSWISKPTTWMMSPWVGTARICFMIFK